MIIIKPYISSLLLSVIGLIALLSPTDGHTRGTNDLDSVASYHYSEGKKYRKSNDFNKSFQHFTKARSRFKAIGDKNYESKSLMYLAILFKQVHAYKKSIETYREVIALKKDFNDKHELAESYLNLSKVYRLTQYYDSAQSTSINNALPIYMNLDSVYGMSKVYNEIGMVYYETGKYNEAIEQYFKALLVVRNTIHEEKRRSKTFNNAANAYIELGKLDKALHYLHKSLKIKESIGYTGGVKFSNYNLAKLYIMREMYDSAAHHLEKATFKIEDSDDYMIYKLNKELEKSHPELVTWQIDDGLIPYFNKVIAQKELSDRYYNFHQVELAMEQLENKDQVSMISKITNIIYIVLILFTIVIIYIVWDTRKKRKAKRILKNA